MLLDDLLPISEGICKPPEPAEKSESIDEVDIGTCLDVGTSSSMIVPPGSSLIVPTLSKSADLGRFLPKSNELKRLLDELESTLPPSFFRE